MSRWFKVLLVIAVLVAAPYLYYYEEIALTANTGTGFAAKNLCSGYHNSGYTFDELKSQALVPINPLFKYISYAYDPEARIVTTSVAGFFKREARYRPGLGCTLLGIGQAELTGSITPASSSPETDLPWPDGNGTPVQKPGIDYTKLKAVINEAFSEPYTDVKRQTKAVLVVHEGNLIAEQYAAPIDKNTLSLSWSMAKSVTNLMVGSLVLRDKLSINDPAPFQSWQGEDDARSAITIDTMLRMSTGLAFNETYGINTDVTYMLSNAVSASDFAMDMPLIHDVDSHWSYASGTSNMLARIVFDTIGGSMQDKYDYFQSALFGPLGMHSATFETDGSNVFVGSSYFYATPRDWAKLGQLMLQDGVWQGERLLPEGWVKYSTTPTPAAAKADYGAHFWLNGQAQGSDKPSVWPELPNDIYFMSGYQGQYVVIVPGDNLVIVRLGYSYPGTDKGMQALISGVIQAIN
jgi:CubicO group peptidase (beta-lactamase class C family)